MSIGVHTESNGASCFKKDSFHDLYETQFSFSQTQKMLCTAQIMSVRAAHSSVVIDKWNYFRVMKQNLYENCRH
jgi:hypothetical protein